MQQQAFGEADAQRVEQIDGKTVPAEAKQDGGGAGRRVAHQAVQRRHRQQPHRQQRRRRRPARAERGNRPAAGQQQPEQQLPAPVDEAVPGAVPCPGQRSHHEKHRVPADMVQIHIGRQRRRVERQPQHGEPGQPLRPARAAATGSPGSARTARTDTRSTVPGWPPCARPAPSGRRPGSAAGCRPPSAVPRRTCPAPPAGRARGTGRASARRGAGPVPARPPAAGTTRRSPPPPGR